MELLKFHEKEPNETVSISNDGVLFYLHINNDTTEETHVISKTFANILLSLNSRVLSFSGDPAEPIQYIILIKDLYNIYNEGENCNACPLMTAANIINAVEDSLFTSINKSIIKELFILSVNQKAFFNSASMIYQMTTGDRHYLFNGIYRGIFTILRGGSCKYVDLRYRYTNYPRGLASHFIDPIFESGKSYDDEDGRLFRYFVIITSLAEQYRTQQECRSAEEFVDKLKSDGLLKSLSNGFGDIWQDVVNYKDNIKLFGGTKL